MLRTTLFCALTASASTSLAQISLESIDTFDADNEGWRVGNAGVDPTFEDGLSFNGEPGFLRHFSDGSGSNGRFIMWSQQSDWTGDYLSAGVSGISLWADGRAGDDLPFWIGFDGPGGWFFTPAQTLVTDNEWERFEFDISPEALIYQGQSGGTGEVLDTLSSVTRFEIFGGPGSVGYASRGDLLRADRSTNVAWFDNISAIPTPGASALLVVATIATRRRR